jgi:hypothetical protein
MKRNTFKLLFISYLLFAGTVACAANGGNTAAAKTSDEKADVVKVSETTAPAKEADEPKLAVPKLTTGASGRAIGNLLNNKAKPAENSNADTSAEQRIQELEELVREQQKLIDMYKKQTN